MEGRNGGKEWREEMEGRNGGKEWREGMEGRNGGKEWREEMEGRDGGKEWIWTSLIIITRFIALLIYLIITDRRDTYSRGKYTAGVVIEWRTKATKHINNIHK